MNRVAIIPARGGSKRLPRKNILPILGRPMLAYPIQAALQCGMFERVIVSTEDKEIREAALEAGAEVLERPNELAQDRARVVDVCGHALEILGKDNTLPDYFCCIYATAIFITPDDLKESFQLFEQEPTPDVVMGVSDFNLHPVQALKEKDGFLTPNWPEYLGVQSQFYPRLMASNGTIYWAKTSVFFHNPTFYTPKLKGYSIPQMRAVDVDTPDDYEFVQILAQHILTGNT